jgi:hypothetical protein
MAISMRLKIGMWTFASIGAATLLVEHIQPSQSQSERVYVVWLCSLSNALVLLGVGTCLDALGV